MAVACVHCGQSSPRGKFCCFGCEIAYGLIKNAGLEAYYQKRQNAISAPNFKEEESFKVFDHPDYLNNLNKDEDGRFSAEFYVENMHCAACVWLIEKLPSLNLKCESARVDFGKSTVEITWKDSLSSILKTLAQMGYTPHPEQPQTSISKTEWIRWAVTGASALASMHLGLLLLAAKSGEMEVGHARWIGLLAALVAAPATFYGGIPFFKSSLLSLRMKRLHPDLLISCALVIGYGFSFISAIKGQTESYFDSMSMVIFLLLGGRLLLRYSTEMLSRPPDWIARRRGDSGDLDFVPATSLKPGDSISVRKSEALPIDGELLSREAWIDESALTGESTPRYIVEGQMISQGAVALSDSFEVVASRGFHDSSLHKLKSHSEKISWSPSNSAAEQIFTAAVLLLSLIVLISPSTYSISMAVGILIATCPCALLLARPLSLFFFIKKAKTFGIEILRPEKILKFDSIENVFFDKTGTLSEGSLELVRSEWRSCDQFSLEQMRNILFSMASQSDHPVSRTIAFELHRSGARSIPIKSKEIEGVGIEAEAFECRFELKRDQRSRRLSAVWKINNTEMAFFEFEDRPRSSAVSCLRKLQKLNLKLGLLSGDRQESVEHFIEKLGVPFETILSEQSPSQKSAHIPERSLYVGDGLNDSLVMGAAQMSIGIAGSREANWKSADIYLLRKDLMTIPILIEAAGRLKKIIHFNIGLSIAYNLITIGLILFGVLGPVVCAIFMPISSLSVLAIAYKAKMFERGGSTFS